MASLARFSLGRVLLHLIAMLGDRALGFHCAGILRELQWLTAATALLNRIGVRFVGALVLVGVLLAVGCPGDALPVIGLYIGASALTACIAAAVLPVTEPRRRRGACLVTRHHRVTTLHL